MKLCLQFGLSCLKCQNHMELSKVRLSYRLTMERTLLTECCQKKTPVKCMKYFCREHFKLDFKASRMLPFCGFFGMYFNDCGISATKIFSLLF